MNLYRHFETAIRAALQRLVEAGTLPPGLDYSRITAEPPRDASHGDIATNAAMLLARPAGRKPRDLAAELAPLLAELPEVEAVDIAGPGFINMRLNDEFWHERLRDILVRSLDYGRSDIGGGEKVNVEYVSANPTGPMHVGHCRGAVFGDALAALLERAGFDVCREYYINDAGSQIDTLARSVYLRYCQAAGREIGEIPEGLYPGAYLIPLGEALYEQVGERWLDAAEAEWLNEIRDFAVEAMMELIRGDLAALGVRHDVFTSEKTLHENGAIQRVHDRLAEDGLIYTGVLEPPKGKKPEDWEPRPQLLFRARQFGDDTDRPLQKSDGSWTYFAADIAYHLDKYERGFANQIDVWGADHGGYVKRMKAAVKAITDNKAELDVKLCQLVNLLEDGKPVKMSKRAGTFVTLRDVVDRVGRGVVRFIMLTRKNDAPLDFDFRKVTEQSRDNPVFYVQYAHARAHSVFRNARRDMPDLDIGEEAIMGADIGLLRHEAEIALIRQMAAWPRLVESAALAHEPHRIAFYLYDLATAFHGLWTKGRDEGGLRFIIADDESLTLARLAMVRAVATIIAAGLDILGVEPMTEM